MLLLTGAGCVPWSDAEPGPEPVPPADPPAEEVPGDPTPADPEGDAEERPEDPDDDPFEPYEEVIPEDAETREGLFTTHRVEDRLHFEIPSTELDKPMLLISRVVEGTGRPATPQQLVRWERHGDAIHLRGENFDAIADSSASISAAVRAMTRGPIVASFDIETFGPDSAAVVEVTSLYTSNVPETAAVRGLQADRSYLEWVAAFPENVEVRATQTGRGSSETSTLQVQWSMIRLPEEPMMPRLHDRRVGFITTSHVDYGRPEHRSEERRYIRRFHLEKENPAAEVSDPVDPIVFWIDPATPEWLVPWVRRGVEQWVEAFEEAGFSNAIEAREAPSPGEDPDWSMHDARHSVIHWRPSTIANATGGSTVDPRSGEIIKAEVNMYHNVMSLLRDWYFVQAAPLDERTRSLPLPDSLMGQLVEYVVAHEVGHAVGFPHNFKASAMYPADSIRSASFLERKGAHVSTVMDYSRFNYVAQPEDEIPPHLLIPRVGPYDRFAVRWGYKPIPAAESPDDELPVLDDWANKQDSVPWFRFTTPDATNDPHAVTEAVGNDDAVLSSRYGMRNLERVMELLLEVAEEPGRDYTLMEDLYGEAVAQWGRYNNHVAALVGGAYSRERYGTGPRFEPVSREKQVEALEFLSENAFRPPSILLDPEILRRIESEGAVSRIRRQQTRTLRVLLSPTRLERLTEYEALSLNDHAPYTVADLMEDIRTGVWDGLEGPDVRLDIHQRNLQRAYLEVVEDLLNGSGHASDGRAVVRGDLRELRGVVTEAARRTDDRLTRLHLQDVAAEMEAILSGRRTDGGGGATPVIRLQGLPAAGGDGVMDDGQVTGCWLWEW